MKTTKKQFAIFKSEIKKLVKIYGLTSWEVICVYEKIDERSIATTAADPDPRIVVFTLNTEFMGDKITDKEVKDIALHEVFELLLNRLEDMVCTSRQKEAREEVHAIIQTLINVKGE